MNGGVPAVSGFHTPLGPMAVSWRPCAGGARVTGIHLPGERLPEPAGRRDPPRELRELIRGLVRFLHGEEVALSIRLLALEDCTPFQREVLLLEHRVPRGMVTTYGLLARALGRPRAARAVGGALGSNPFPLVIPCHRTVRADGSPGGFGGGPAMKRRLLELEGVRFGQDGRVPRDLVFCGW
ncbi:MAG: methylated-DNA--[protein]-cysteine S-methyltransferase [Spirochaetota bacterium]